MRRDRVTVAIIGEGITEQYYFLSLRDVLSVKPTPVLPKKSNLKELEISIKDCIKRGYSEIYCLIDMDNKVPDGNPDHQRNAADYNRLKQRYHNKQHKSPDGSKCNVWMVESYPSTEIFFLYYFGYTGAFYTNQGLKSLLNKKFGYMTQQRYLIQHSLHDTLVGSGGNLETAIRASQKSVIAADACNLHRTYSQIGKLILRLVEGLE